MYMPELFAVTDGDEIESVLRNVRLGCLVTRDSAGFFGTHLPVIFDPARRVLAAHVARANPHPESSGDGEALVIFQGANAYVSPSWYPSKREHGKVVPTWNYEAVHVSGTLSWRRDAAWIAGHLAALTERFEQARPEPWSLADAPEDFLERQMAGVIGLELDVRDVQVTRKLSQNRSPDDRSGVIAGLLESDSLSDRAVGAEMVGCAP
ncbi:MAG: transcriptional regulator [Phenylobacterium sp.]|nr:transcriptional regulator [Phenylobacterium sp.]